MPVPQGKKGVEKVMREYKAGKLHSGKNGKTVKSRKQAVAIAMSESGMAKKKSPSSKRKETKKTTILSVPKRGTIKVKKPPRMGAGVPGFKYGRETK